MYSVGLFVIHCNDLTVIVLKKYKGAAVLSVLMKVYSIACHERGHINVMLILQSCTDSLHILPGSSSETFPSLSDGTYDVGNIEDEGDVVVIGEGSIVRNKELDIDIKQEEIPEDIIFPSIKAESDEVSYVHICLLFDTFYQCPVI